MVKKLESTFFYLQIFDPKYKKIIYTSKILSITIKFIITSLETKNMLNKKPFLSHNLQYLVLLNIKTTFD